MHLLPLNYRNVLESISHNKNSCEMTIVVIRHYIQEKAEKTLYFIT